MARASSESAGNGRWAAMSVRKMLATTSASRPASHGNDHCPTMHARRDRRIGTRQRAGGWGAASHNVRLAVPDVTTATSIVGPSCRAPAARRAGGTKRERTHSRMQRRHVRAVSARLEDGDLGLSHRTCGVVLLVRV
jgi:hypothetical protein